MNSGENNAPRISVLMSVYSDEDTVEASVRSILDQTFEDFEFIIVNDGSTDRTPEILSRLAKEDGRVQVIDQKNRGLTRSLNRALKLARGEYTARQDGDDISHPERFLKQIELLDNRSEVVLLGSNSVDISDDGNRSEWGWQDDDQLQRTIFNKAPFPHSTAMMRTQLAQELNGYDESYLTSQDMEFWMRFAKKGRVTMIKQPLVTRAVRKGAISNQRFFRQVFDAARARMSHAPYGFHVTLYHSARHLILGLMPRRLALFLKKHFGA